MDLGVFEQQILPHLTKRIPGSILIYFISNFLSRLMELIKHNKMRILEKCLKERALRLFDD